MALDGAGHDSEVRRGDLRDNFALFERFPHYVFSFEGAFHYMRIKEYYPEAWPELKEHVAAGRWRLLAWMNAVDTNMPSPESLIRQALYGSASTAGVQPDEPRRLPPRLLRLRLRAALDRRATAA